MLDLRRDARYTSPMTASCRAVELTPEIIALIDSAIGAIYSLHGQMCCEGDDCTCYSEARRLKELFLPEAEPC